MLFLKINNKLMYILLYFQPQYLYLLLQQLCKVKEVLEHLNQEKFSETHT